MTTSTKEQTLYAQLGVSQTATEQEIRTAYRRLIRDAHPDRGGSVEETQRLNAIYETLGTATNRAEYDRELRRAAEAEAERKRQAEEQRQWQRQAEEARRAAEEQAQAEAEREPYTTAEWAAYYDQLQDDVEPVWQEPYVEEYPQQEPVAPVGPVDPRSRTVRHAHWVSAVAAAASLILLCAPLATTMADPATFGQVLAGAGKLFSLPSILWAWGSFAWQRRPAWEPWVVLGLCFALTLAGLAGLPLAVGFTGAVTPTAITGWLLAPVALPVWRFTRKPRRSRR